MELSFVQMFREGGIWMYIILALALAANPLALLGLLGSAAARAQHKTLLIACGAICLTLSVLIVTVGVAGYFIGLQEMESALQMATPENQEKLRAAGERMASYPLYFAIGASVLPDLGGMVALVRGFALKRG